MTLELADDFQELVEVHRLFEVMFDAEEFAASTRLFIFGGGEHHDGDLFEFVIVVNLGQDIQACENLPAWKRNSNASSPSRTSVRRCCRPPFFMAAIVSLASNRLSSTSRISMRRPMV
jgi:hypothetical protein